MFAVKYRKDMFLNEEYVTYMKIILSEIEKRYYITTETAGFDEDHVHLLVQAAPRYSPSKVIQILKSITAREMFREFPEIKKDLWGGEYWNDGGYIGTVGEGGNADIIRKYIKNQGRKGDQLRILSFIPEA
jgi:putative transposase